MRSSGAPTWERPCAPACLRARGRACRMCVRVCLFLWERPFSSAKIANRKTSPFAVIRCTNPSGLGIRAPRSGERVYGKSGEQVCSPGRAHDTYHPFANMFDSPPIFKGNRLHCWFGMLILSRGLKQTWRRCLPRAAGT